MSNKQKKQIPKKRRCQLPPFSIKTFFGIQDLGQRLGWNITAFNLPSVWEKTRGEGVKVAILDTGVDFEHEDLKENLLEGMNFVEPGKPPMDGCRHGTHCAGIVAARDNGVGVVGVSPLSKIIPVKILDDDGSGDMLDVCKGILWAVENGADIISMSLGCESPVQQVRKAIQVATSKGIPVFCAAGNSNMKKLFYPAGYPETISIAAVDKKFNKANFSNIAKNLNFFAPGVDILSTIPGGQYGLMSGTSMACPWAAGIAALALSYVRSHKTNIKLNSTQDYINLLKNHSDQVNNSTFQGLGLIDPCHFLDWVAS